MNTEDAPKKSYRAILISLAIATVASLGYAGYTKWELIVALKETDAIKANDQTIGRKVDENAKLAADLKEQINALKSANASQRDALDAFHMQANIWEEARKKLKLPG